MAIRDRMSGNEAIAMAMKQINPDVMGAFPNYPFYRNSAIFFRIYR